MILAIFIGFCLGLLSAAVTESIGHKLTGHPGPTQRRLYLRYPRLFYPFLRPMYQHLVIHHHKTFQGNFFAQFESAEEKRKTDEWIARSFAPDFAALVWRERYNLTLEGFTGTIPFAIPFCLGPLLIWTALGPLAFLGSLLAAFLPVWLSKYVHPLIHLPEDTARAHPFIRWLMRTRYARHVFRNHFLHHLHPEANFNLLLGGDQLLSLHRKASPEEEKTLAGLLEEFDRRVRQEPDSRAPGRAPGGEGTSAIEAYLALGNPTFEQRFQHQLWRATQPAHAGPEFGLSVHDKDIRLEGWARREEFLREAYQASGSHPHRVRYRGHDFATGDLLLTNQDSDSDGIYSTLLERQINFSHAALVVMLRHEGRSYPAAVEINEQGIRAVPLKAILGPRFNTYLEIFRPRQAPSLEQQDLLAESALALLREDHAFDIYQDASQTYYLNCSRTVAEIYRRAGLETPAPASRYAPETFPNLHTLGIGASRGQPLLMPDDFARSPRFSLAGVLDNGRFDDLLARGLVRERIQEIWRTLELSPRHFPLSYPLNRFVVRSIQEESFGSGLFLRAVGLSRSLFPAGPDVFLSLAPFANRFMKESTRRLRQDLAAHRTRIPELGTWEALRADPQIRTIVLDCTSPFRSLFEGDREPLLRRSRPA